MFGLCVLNRFTFLFLFSLLFPLIGWAQAQQATVINDGSLVYQDPDFDAPVIETLARGSVHNISKGKKGPFYKIRVKQGLLGWIADTDVKPGVFKVSTSSGKERIKKSDAKKERAQKQKPFFATRYRGVTVDWVNYTEETLGKERSAGLLFYGLKFNGFNTVIEGDIYTEANIVFHSGPPDYYRDTTKKSADGFIFMANFLLQTPTPVGKNILFYYGFGPMLKYSTFNLEVPNGASSLVYTASDLSVGALFDLGLAFRMGSFTLRSDTKYYWEKTKYYSVGLSLGLDF